MDAEGYLKSHGWRGLGYSLDQKDRGLKKPLLVSKKVDVLGLGKQKHQVQSDQWWMRAFDESLKQIGTGQKTTLDSVRKNGVNKGGLYGFFVRGEELQGTIVETPTLDSAVADRDAEEQRKERKKKKKEKRKREDGGGDKESKRSRKAERPKKRSSEKRKHALKVAKGGARDEKE